MNKEFLYDILKEAFPHAEMKNVTFNNRYNVSVCCYVIRIGNCKPYRFYFIPNTSNLAMTCDRRSKNFNVYVNLSNPNIDPIKWIKESVKRGKNNSYCFISEGDRFSTMKDVM